jgi:apolipoprotein N-acyltransferase
MRRLSFKDPGLALLCGLLFVLSFPKYDLSLFAWFALIPFFLAIDRREASDTFWLGWLAGGTYFLGTVNWVTITMERYGKVPVVVSFFLMLLLVAYLGLYFGIFGFLLRYFSRQSAKTGAVSPLTLVILAPSLWVTLEYLRGHLLTGFPWALLGYSQYRILPIIQISDITGVYGVSFLIVTVNAALFLIIRRRDGFPPGKTANFLSSIAISLLLVLLSVGYGYWRIKDLPLTGGHTIKTAVIQGNIPQDVKWDEAYLKTTMETYRRLTDKVLPYRPDLVVWPESAAPFLFESDAVGRQEIIPFVKDRGFYLLFGSPGAKLVNRQVRLQNSAYLLSEQGSSLGRYDKIHLVPFGEYVPLSSILFFVDKLVEGIGDFVPGERYTVMELPQGKIGTVICFEVIFPEVVRKIVRNGAQLMTTITNDAWFGRSSAAYQHFSMVVFRAVENRVSFARAANTGISGFIEPTGRITQHSPLFVEDALISDLPILQNGFTPYTRWGDFFAYVCVIITICFMVGLKPAKKTKGEK